MNTLFLDALQGINTQRPPVWLMRQAGRYLPSYRKLREKFTLSQLFHNSQLAAEITKQPIDQLGLDAAILFSDILVILESLGFSVVYPETGGPFIENAPKNIDDIFSILKQPVDEKLHYVAETIQLLIPDLSVPLIGFCGGPLTVMAYLLDRPVGPEMKNTKKWLSEEPELMHGLLQKITDVSIDYLNMQIESGVSAVQIFDSWAGLLSYSDFLTFCLPYLQQMVDAIKKTDVPVILFCRGSGLWFSELSSIKPSAISLDWQTDMEKIKKIAPEGLALQGNLDPSLTRGSPDVMEEKTQALLEIMRGSKNFIVNLGHGLFPDSRVDTVQRLVETVKNFSPEEATKLQAVVKSTR